MDLFDVRCLGVTIAKSSTECCSMANLSSFAVLAMQKKNAMDEDAIPVRFESSSSGWEREVGMFMRILHSNDTSSLSNQSRNRSIGANLEFRSSTVKMAFGTEEVRRPM